MILTAAHCAVTVSNGQFKSVTNDLWVIAGVDNLHLAGSDGIRAKVKNVYVPEEYQPSNTVTNYFITADIAVLEVIDTTKRPF